MKNQRYWEIGDRERIVVAAKRWLVEWGRTRENLYEELNILCIRLGTNRAFLSVLQVILVPHSHTDPGCVKTFEQYFHSSTRSILNNMVSKLQQWPNMTFIWSEKVTTIYNLAHNSPMFK
ncbi:Alpha-mannosidase 2x [Melipona quadrifasciata]|uniref:Alpha-mannosidase 2x n=1 Tax=Melipona quadrifasciata TaxID=166423 RepID=A0A0M9A3C9_9HYME|nr:Alpha-mannosidase 2x [Melipona quadrifasciata]